VQDEAQKLQPTEVCSCRPQIGSQIQAKNLLQKLTTLGEVFSLDKANKSPTKFNLEIKFGQDQGYQKRCLPPTHNYPFLCVYISQHPNTFKKNVFAPLTL
jgi:hypothetical protein